MRLTDKQGILSRSGAAGCVPPRIARKPVAGAAGTHFVAACIAVVIVSVAALGPRTNRLELEAIAH